MNRFVYVLGVEQSIAKFWIFEKYTDDVYSADLSNDVSEGSSFVAIGLAAGEDELMSRLAFGLLSAAS